VTSSGVPNEVAQAAIRRIWNKEIPKPEFERDLGRGFKAVDLACDACGATVGNPREGLVFCASRMDQPAS